uniref:UDENN domain-containing protein n=1 Tax=Esox lucius TaxID=8010 RepID=A0AAY5L5M9_ESOLU
MVGFVSFYTILNVSSDRLYIIVSTALLRSCGNEEICMFCLTENMNHYMTSLTWPETLDVCPMCDWEVMVCFCPVGDCGQTVFLEVIGVFLCVCVCVVMVPRVSPSQLGQNFTFVLTDIQSKQRFGFCRLTSGCRVCICLLSYLPWFEIYYKLLNTLADYLTKNQDNELNDMLNSLYGLPVPKPFTPVNLSVVGTVGLLENLTEYFVAVDVNNMLQLYASMLHERRIIITSSKLSTLTACVHGSASMLFPMYWQHIYIPVLPPHLLDYCCAPMPYLVGVHFSLLERVRSRSLEDVVILNVDTNTLESAQDDLQDLPSEVVHSLKSKLKKQSTATGSGVARAFLRAQAALFGSYRDALRYKPGEPITFCEESFVAHRSSTLRNFLEMAVNLQLFKQFIDGRLAKLNAGRGFTDLFEEEITEGGFCGSNSRSYQQWVYTVKVCKDLMISSEDSGEVASYTEDSDDSYSLELDTDSSLTGQMNLLEEILDSLSGTTTEQGKLSGAKSLDFFRSMDDIEYKAPNKSNPPSENNLSQLCASDQLGGGWQDDSALHRKHLPPSPRRQPSKSSLKLPKQDVHPASPSGSTPTLAQNLPVPRVQSQAPQTDVQAKPHTSPGMDEGRDKDRLVLGQMDV